MPSLVTAITTQTGRFAICPFPILTLMGILKCCSTLGAAAATTGATKVLIVLARAVAGRTAAEPAAGQPTANDPWSKASSSVTTATSLRSDPSYTSLAGDTAMTREELTAIIRTALGNTGDVISADVIAEGELGIETTDGRFFVTVQPID
ncbi:hypothetical protein [Streptomyces sp. NPDC055036]